MADGNGIGSRTVTLLLSASAVSALVVFLGRLWAQSYFSVVGLPTDSLTLDVQDYAFRTREVLVMVILATLVGGLIIVFRRPLVAPGGLVPLRWRRIALVVIMMTAFVSFIIAFANFPLSDPAWRILAFLTGIVAGTSIAAVVLAVPALERNLFSIAGLSCFGLAVAVILIPQTVATLGRAAARSDLAASRFPQAIIEFHKDAPMPIRSKQDPHMSTRVYVVLSTPKQLGVAFPFRCRTFEAKDETESVREFSQTDICHTLAFDKSEVRSVRSVQTQGPHNDERSHADSLELTGALDQSGPTTVYHDQFDLALAREVNTGSTMKSCTRSGDAPLPRFVRGVWVELLARQSGRVTFASAPRAVGLFDDDSTACRALLATEDAPALHVSVGDRIDVLFATAKTDDLQQETIELLFEPGALLAGDCRLERARAALSLLLPETSPAAQPMATPTEFRCGATAAEDGRITLSTGFDLAEVSHVSITVPAVAASTAAGCDERDAPQVALALAALRLDGCEQDSATERVAWTYRSTVAVFPGAWTLTVCGPRVQGLVVTATALGADGGPAAVEVPALRRVLDLERSTVGAGATCA